MTKHVAIITDVKYRMSLALMRDLKEAGVYIAAVECDKNAPALGFFSKCADECHMLSQEKYKEELIALCGKLEEEFGVKPVLMPVGAKTLAMVSGAKKEFEAVCGLCVPEKETLDLLNDKERLHTFAAGLGVPLPEEYEAPYDDACFPCIVKPVCGEQYGIKAADRYRIVSCKEELKEAAALYEKLCPGSGIVVQKYINGKGFGCSVAAENGEIKSLICHERIREYPVSGGPSACCRAVYSDDLKEQTQRIVKALGFSGIAMFEYKQGEDGKLRLLECNPRVWGSFPLTRVSGSDFIAVWFELGSGGAFKAEKRSYKEVRMHFALSDIASGLGYIKNGHIGKGLGAFADCINPAVRGGLFELSDMKPAFKYLKRAFK